MEHYLKLVGKMIASAVLIFALLFSIGLTIALAPLYMALASKRGASSAIFELLPFGILSGLLWRLWQPDPTAKYEELAAAYRDGLEKGYSGSAKPTARVAK